MNKKKKREEKKKFNFAINFHISILKKSPTFTRAKVLKKEKGKRKKDKKKERREIRKWKEIKKELGGVVKKGKGKGYKEKG